MNGKWQKAVDAAAELYQTGCINYKGYRAIRDGLDEITTLAERDATLESLWHEFEDIPMNPETECMEAPFLDFPAGTHREDIWHWFDERHSKGITYLLYRTGNQSGKCYTVVDTSYDVGINVYSFWRRQDAEQSVKDDVQTELTNLREAGREQIEVQETPNGATIYVPDTDIYYEWTIMETDIR